MKWLSRFLWLAAWCAWVWLGFGLYRELPRELGPVVCKLPIDPNQMVWFIGDSSHVVVQQAPIIAVKAPLRIYDAKTGAFVREILYDGRWPELTWDARLHRIGVSRGSMSKLAGLDVLDLTTGTWTSLSKWFPVGVAVHPTKTWFAFRESARPVDKPRQAVVVDWTTGAEVFLRPSDSKRAVNGSPFFLGDSDRLCIPVLDTTMDHDREPPTDLEVWRIGGMPQLEKVVRLPWTRFRPGASSPGRLSVFVVGPKDSRLDVFEVDTEQVIFSTPTTPHLPGGSFQLSSRFSIGGRGVMAGIPSKLWDVDSGAVLWESKPGQRYGRDLDDDTFTVVEHWDQQWTRGKLSRWNTVAHRDLDTGKLLTRCWERDASVLISRSADGTLGLAVTGVVYQLPFRVNWPLFALCQAILASPLMLLWAILRHRKRRAARRQAAVAKDLAVSS